MKENVVFSDMFKKRKYITIFMILGIGTDILDLKRFRKVLNIHKKTCHKLFTEKEIALGETFVDLRREAFYAKRFSGKEALFKACGVGPGALLSWKDFSILPEPSGKPKVFFSPRVLHFCRNMFSVSNITFHISLSDEKTYVQAFSILEGFPE